MLLVVAASGQAAQQRAGGRAGGGSIVRAGGFWRVTREWQARASETSGMPPRYLPQED
jgi:hypothetical protein